MQRKRRQRMYYRCGNDSHVGIQQEFTITEAQREEVEQEYERVHQVFKMASSKKR